ncbi:hypothetical protein [Arthrobacter sp. 4R501]|uniref:hypothetical protein n=1 Tax=Arthrobacter sp. 4R501 TaxID=2058886 RepID=UPI0011B0C408|nr:hypothetical protein [Arthrobacter sp. 4R501]
MTHAQESRPGHESKAAINLATNSIPAATDETTATALVTGVHVVVVETAEGKYRRRVYFNLPGAQRAADRAVMSGHAAHIILCQLMPVGGAL